MTTQMFKLTTQKQFFLKKVTEFFVRIYDAFIEARRLQAAMATAQHLKAYNRDYRHMSLGDIVNQIMDEK